ncbi:MAG: hypothetical protein CL402_04715 [Acidiferrobacteraceae bacterium]|nr:hypothetical protein [Acidiferrobacteraceae bacterium]
MLKITDLSLRRGSRLLLENVNLDVFSGQRIGLTGANGSGKSSLTDDPCTSSICRVKGVSNF